MKTTRIFHLKVFFFIYLFIYLFFFSVVKFSIYLNRRVFVMLIWNFTVILCPENTLSKEPAHTWELGTLSTFFAIF